MRLDVVVLREGRRGGRGGGDWSVVRGLQLKGEAGRTGTRRCLGGVWGGSGEGGVSGCRSYQGRGFPRLGGGNAAILSSGCLRLWCKALTVRCTRTVTCTIVSVRTWMDGWIDVSAGMGGGCTMVILLSRRLWLGAGVVLPRRRRRRKTY